MPPWVAYQTVLWLAAGATAAYLLVRRAIAPGTLTASALWGYLGLQGSNIVLHEGGSTYTVSLPYLQYVAAFLSIISLAAFVLWILGVYPPEDEQEQLAAADAVAGDSPAGQAEDPFRTNVER